MLDIEWFHLPVEDDQAPGEAFNAAWAQHVPRLKQLLTEGKTIAIHCKGGSGRTGLVAAQLLIETGVLFSDAIRDVQSLRPRAIQHPAHIEYIGQFDTQTNAH